MKTRSISIVIPAYNEEACIEKSVSYAESVMAGVTPDFEIVVVDDASRDRTKQILEQMQKSRPYLKVASHSVNRGLGGTLRTGFALCEKDITFYSDADLPFDFEELKKALRVMEIKDAGCVTGFRHDRTSEGFIRIVYSLCYNLLIRLLFGIEIRDVNFSFKLFKTKDLKRMQLKSEGSFIDAEMMVKADRMNLFLCQIGIDYFKRNTGQSSLSSPKTILYIFREMFALYPGLRRFTPQDA